MLSAMRRASLNNAAPPDRVRSTLYSPGSTTQMPEFDSAGSASPINADRSARSMLRTVPPHPQRRFERIHGLRLRAIQDLAKFSLGRVSLARANCAGWGAVIAQSQ